MATSHTGKVQTEVRDHKHFAKVTQRADSRAGPHVAPHLPLHNVATALASVEPRKAKEKGTSWLRPHSSFGVEPGLLTPGTPWGGRGNDFCLNC